MTKRSLLIVLLAGGIGLFGYIIKEFGIEFTRANYMPVRSKLAEVGALGYKDVSCPVGGTEIAIFGQSNSANSVRPLAKVKIPNNLYQYDWRNKKCFEYKEPLLGSEGIGGNAITHAALKIATNTSKPVLIIPFGLGGISVLDWAYGSAADQQEAVLKSMKITGINPKVFLWHQGESDYGLSKTRYLEALQFVVNRTRQYYPNSYFGVALASRCRSDHWQPIRQAQVEIANVNKRSFISVDSDKIYGQDVRYDQCHFSEHGAKKLGEKYYLSLSLLP